MKERYIIASDSGGSGTKTMIFDLKGRAIAKAFRSIGLYHPEPGATVQDPEEMLESVLESIKECLEVSNIQPNEVEAIVFDGQQAGLIWIDDNYEAISAYDSWLDNRFGDYSKLMSNICGEVILQKTGTPYGTIGPKILWWKNNRGDVFEKACKMVIPSSYIGGRLAGLRGNEAYFENTSLGYSGIADIRESKWDEEICQTVGIPLDKLPKIVKPTEIIGKLSKDFAAKMGLTSGIPIVAGAGDFPAAAVGAGVCFPQQSGDIAGTASMFFGCTEDWRPDSTGLLRVLQSPIEGLWYEFGLVGGGACLQWFYDKFLKETGTKETFESLENKARNIHPGDNKLLFYPYIGGRLQPLTPDYNGAWIGIKFDHQIENFYLAILESIAYEYKNYSLYLRNLLNISEFRETRVFGGGSVSSLWNQIKADILGVPYLVMDQQECSLLGSMLIAGKSIGVFDDLQSVSNKMNRVKERFNPNIMNTKKYVQTYKAYFDLLNSYQDVLRFG